jgi:hypothetical protein
MARTLMGGLRGAGLKQDEHDLRDTSGKAIDNGMRTGARKSSSNKSTGKLYPHAIRVVLGHFLYFFWAAVMPRDTWTILYSKARRVCMFLCQ